MAKARGREASPARAPKGAATSSSSARLARQNVPPLALSAAKLAAPSKRGRATNGDAGASSSSSRSSSSGASDNSDSDQPMPSPRSQQQLRTSSRDKAELTPTGSALTATSNGGAGAAAADQDPAVVQQKRWKDWSVRWVTTIIMIVGVLLYVYATRQLGVTIFVLVLQTLIYNELVAIQQKASVEASMPGFKLFYHYWFAVFTFYMYSNLLKPHVFAALGLSTTVGEAALATGSASGSSLSSQLYALSLKALIFTLRNTVPIAFSLYMIGFVGFVVSLRRRRNFKYQFKQFGFCHLALLLVVVPSTYYVSNVFQGLFWFMLPIALVVANDSWAYVFGFLFGRTPLIRLSPKKTVEGFVGGAVMTFVVAWALTGLLQSTDAFNIRHIMLCPGGRDFGLSVHRCNTDSEAGGIFRLTPVRQWWFGDYYLLPLFNHLQAVSYLPFKAFFLSLFRDYLLDARISEMQFHSLILAAFASVVAPFGGFFASGLKRSLKLKDFGSAIPGHGGFTDRMDCQIVMGAFSAIYMRYVLQLGEGLRGGPGDVLRVFGRIAERFSGQDVALLQQLLACFVARLPALGEGPNGTAAATASALGSTALPRDAVILAARQCKENFPQMTEALEGYAASLMGAQAQ